MGEKRSVNSEKSNERPSRSNSTRVRKRFDSSSACSSLERMLPLWRKMKSAMEATTPLRSGQETRRMTELCISYWQRHRPGKHEPSARCAERSLGSPWLRMHKANPQDRPRPQSIEKEDQVFEETKTQ